MCALENSFDESQKANERMMWKWSAVRVCVEFVLKIINICRRELRSRVVEVSMKFVWQSTFFCTIMKCDHFSTHSGWGETTSIKLHFEFKWRNERNEEKITIESSRHSTHIPVWCVKFSLLLLFHPYSYTQTSTTISRECRTLDFSNMKTFFNKKQQKLPQSCHVSHSPPTANKPNSMKSRRIAFIDQPNTALLYKLLIKKVNILTWAILFRSTIWSWNDYSLNLWWWWVTHNRPKWPWPPNKKVNWRAFFEAILNIDISNSSFIISLVCYLILINTSRFTCSLNTRCGVLRMYVKIQHWFYESHEIRRWLS